MDMVVLGDICRWQPSEVMYMPTERRRRLADVLIERARRVRERPADEE